MKTILIKIAMIFLSIVLAFTTVINCYMLIVTYKLSESTGILEKINVFVQYKVLQNVWIGAFSLLFTIILLSLMQWFIFKEFLFKKKVFYLKENA
jgi:hypothetical protein